MRASRRIAKPTLPMRCGSLTAPESLILNKTTFWLLTQSSSTAPFEPFVARLYKSLWSCLVWLAWLAFIENDESSVLVAKLGVLWSTNVMCFF